MRASIDKYQQDPDFRALVDFLVLHLVREEGYTTKDLVDATELVKNLEISPTPTKSKFLH